MKKITKFFILFQALDIIITFLAINFGIAFEGNPLGFSKDSIILKLLVTNLICFTLEKIEFPKIIWIIPGISGVVVIWNCFVICVELVAKIRLI